MKKNVTLVLGSGGARGLTQLGVIKRVIDSGFVVDEVVGCSIGSLIGAAFAENKHIELGEWMSKLTKRDVFRLMDFANPRYGFLKGNKVFLSLKEIFDDIPIENMKMKYSAVAVDLITENEVIFQQGSVYNAIRASIAIPGVFKSVVTTDGKYLVDGGVLNPLPLQFVQNQQNIVIAVNLEGNSESLTTINYEKLNAISVLQESYLAMRRRLTKLNIDLYKPDYVIHVPHNLAGIWDFDKAEELIEMGYSYASEVLKDLKDD